MKLKVITIDEDSKYLELVIKLGDDNSKTLGFFPKSAFKQAAKNQKILVSIDEYNDIFLGYLLYNVNKRSKNISIVHFCIDSSYRGRGIAEYLFNELKNKTDNGFYKGIRVHCRRDYGIDDFWKKLAFHPRDEKRGRGKKDTRLTVWWYDYKTLSLLNHNDNDKLNTKQKVVLDASIFFDLEKDVTKNIIESQELLANWLQENIEFCLTNEIFDEINRKDNVFEREKARKAAYKYELIEQENQDVASQLRGFYAEEVYVDTPKNLFRKFNHLGIYEWRDIFAVAKNNIHQPIMAFKFTKTELFSNPLSKDTMQAVWSHFSPPQRPVSIPNDMFYKLYQLGLDKNL